MTQFTSIWVTQSHKHIALAQKFHTPKYPFAYLSCETQRISLLWFCERGSATNNSSESYNFQTLKIKKKIKKNKTFFPSPKYDTLKCLPLKLNLHSFNAFHSFFPSTLCGVFLWDNDNLESVLSFTGGHSVTNHLLFPTRSQNHTLSLPQKIHPFISTKSKLSNYNITFEWWKFLLIETN